MTTIVYNPEEGVVASDSQETDDSRKMPCKKLFKVHGHIIATAGESYPGLLFVQWFKDCKGEPVYGKHALSTLNSDYDFECLVVRPDGSAYTLNHLLIPYDHAGQVAIGSGAAAALAALYAGASAKDAVKIACRIDAYTSGPVQTMRI